MHAFPQESKIDPKKPMMKRRLFSVSTSRQYQDTPIIRISMLEKHEVEKEIVMASNPTFGDVRCLMKRPEATKKQGVKIPKSTATHLGICSSGSS
tara:strand:+ start:414 stop:698 length:285 start_codon:yes stop_codon:yes gene_type:complete